MGKQYRRACLADRTEGILLGDRKAFWLDGAAQGSSPCASAEPGRAPAKKSRDGRSAQNPPPGGGGGSHLVLSLNVSL